MTNYMKIKLLKSDITELDVEVIVNAAKSSLRGGSGVDGAIHHKAGKELLEECIQIGGCMTGDAKLTKGYNLKVPFIIHTVGPVYFNGLNDEDKHLASCYHNSLKLAENHQFKSIAFPCISTGGYNFPSKKAAKIALTTIQNFPYQSIEEVIICCYTEKDYIAYKLLMERNLFKRLFYWIKQI